MSRDPRYPATSVDAFIGMSPREIRSRNARARAIEAREASYVTGGDVPRKRCTKCGNFTKVDGRLCNGPDAPPPRNRVYWIACGRCGPLTRPFKSRAEAVRVWDGTKGC